MFGGKYGNKYFNTKGQIMVPAVVDDVDELAESARKRAMIHEAHIFETYDETWLAFFEITGILDWNFAEEENQIIQQVNAKFEFDMHQMKTIFGQEVRNFLRIRKGVNSAIIGIENF